MMHSVQTYWTKDLQELTFFCLYANYICTVISSGPFTDSSYLSIHGWDYHWGYKHLAFFCLNANLICISFFWHLWTVINGSVIRY